MLIRQQIGAADQSDEALLRALLTGDAANRDQNAQLALIRTDFTTTLIANEQAAAVARQALLVRMTAAEAAIVTTSKALADTTGAYGSRIGAIELAFADPLSGLGATRLAMQVEAHSGELGIGELSLLAVEEDGSWYISGLGTVGDTSGILMSNVLRLYDEGKLLDESWWEENLGVIGEEIF